MKTYWTTRNGKKIDIDEMSIEHLRNCLKMVVRAVEKKQHKFKLNGDIANMYNDDEELADLQAEYDAEDYGCR
jgi:hypothetical protein